jgi:D-serine deaminase-like pyridoxal phosphate-dependent protein
LPALHRSGVLKENVADELAEIVVLSRRLAFKGVA